jgi:hypothetical protein
MSFYLFLSFSYCTIRYSQPGMEELWACEKHHEGQGRKEGKKKETGDLNSSFG